MVLSFNGEVCMFVISYVAHFTRFTSVTDFHERVDAKKTFGCTWLSYDTSHRLREFWPQFGNSSNLSLFMYPYIQ